MESMVHGMNSPPPLNSSYLPSYLMGEPEECVTPRLNTCTPNKGGRMMPFNSTSVTMSLDNRSMSQPISPISPISMMSPLQSQQQQLQQQLLQHQHQHQHQQQQQQMQQQQHLHPHKHQNMETIQNLNINMNGPPTKSLFDTIQHDENILQKTPETIKTQSTVIRPPYGAPIPAATALYHLQSHNKSANFNEPYMNKSLTYNPNTIRPLQSLNATAITEPNNSLLYQIDATTRLEQNPSIEYTLQPRDYWITIFGFPPAAVSSILDHFTQCGIIVDKRFPKESGNWLHLRFKSRIECEKALSFNEKIINNNLMIGVTNCKDPEVYEKENTTEIFTHTERFMPIAQQEYITAKNTLSPTYGNSGAGKNSRFVNKAMDILFGW